MAPPRADAPARASAAERTIPTAEKMAADLTFLEAAGATVAPVVFDGGHRWTGAFREAAGRFPGSIA